MPLGAGEGGTGRRGSGVRAVGSGSGSGCRLPSFQLQMVSLNFEVFFEPYQILPIAFEIIASFSRLLQHLCKLLHAIYCTDGYICTIDAQTKTEGLEDLNRRLTGNYCWLDVGPVFSGQPAVMILDVSIRGTGQITYSYKHFCTRWHCLFFKKSVCNLLYRI